MFMWIVRVKSINYIDFSKKKIKFCLHERELLSMN